LSRRSINTEDWEGQREKVFLFVHFSLPIDWEKISRGEKREIKLPSPVVGENLVQISLSI
jgi:hypothetical protein